MKVRVCAYMYGCVEIHICLHVYVYMKVISAYMHVHLYVCRVRSTCMFAQTYVVHECVYIYMLVLMCLCLYVSCWHACADLVLLGRVLVGILELLFRVMQHLHMLKQFVCTRTNLAGCHKKGAPHMRRWQDGLWCFCLQQHR